MTTGVSRVTALRLRGGHLEQVDDAVASEVPLEVRVDGRPYAVLMRTPGADRTLVAGFLLSERLIASADDLATIEHCTDSDLADDAAANTVSVSLTEEAGRRAVHLLASRRDVMATAACGVCGRTTLASMQLGLTPLASGLLRQSTVVASLTQRLRASQPLFAETGGMHAAAAFDADGTVVTSAEDVGRHNAVDKVCGALLLRDALPASSLTLCVSGRTSYEIVQKAWCAGIPVVVSVSAPSSLAVSLAGEAGITLVGFVRDGGLNIYTHAGRIRQD